MVLVSVMRQLLPQLQVQLQASLPPNAPPHLGQQQDTATKPRERLKKPPLYRVLLLNDDFTPMDFVVDILETIFRKNHEEATIVMLHVHNHGVGVCGIYSCEVAESKVQQVLDYAHAFGHPLRCTMERA
jgi:ATP-dependent Clp protease adaptor protein ClpS